MWDEGFGFNFPWKEDVHKLFLKAFEWCLQMCCLKKPLCFSWLLLLRELEGRGFSIGYSMISEATESRYVISWIWVAWITGGRREPGRIQPWRNYLRRILYERDCSFWSNNFHEPWIICKFRQILFGSPIPKHFKIFATFVSPRHLWTFALGSGIPKAGSLYKGTPSM